MAKGRQRGPVSHKFREKLVLNQWMMYLLGVDPFHEADLHGRKVRPWHALAAPIRDQRMEGLDESNIHWFYRNLVSGPLFPDARIDAIRLLGYEENIVRHTQRINEKRERPIRWKYHQWLTLLFTEIYLDRYFNDREGLLTGLNEFVAAFNQRWNEFAEVPAYSTDDLNKLCYQNATGSGKTLIMHVNLLQFQHYAKQVGREDELSRVILLTPNDRLSEQHQGELAASGIPSMWYTGGEQTLFLAQTSGLRRVDILEITKLQDVDGPTTIATRSLGDQNLMLVDEGHRGMSGKEEGVWLDRRNKLCAKGFTFEYSATFEQAVAAASRPEFENAYAKCVLFDYSYRYFYEDGFGKDYQILNLPRTYKQNQEMYLTACLLKFYQQLRIYEEGGGAFAEFNLEKPLWVFAGSSVVKAAGGSKDEMEVASDVAQVLQFVADFLAQRASAIGRIGQLMTGTGQDTGLLDEDNTDIFQGAFNYLAREMNHTGQTPEQLYGDILARVFQNPAGGRLTLARIKGDSGEIALVCGQANEPFGLINVGDAAGLCKHCEQHCKGLDVAESEFAQPMFQSVRDSSSPVNLLVGSKKFIEGWDCWRVSTMGLMHVGKSEGTQIIQLFGRGVRLKGWEWSLKRSGKTFAPRHPAYIEELETLNVFGIEADFMQRFRDFLREEGLPGNERRHTVTIPLNVTYDFGKKLMIVRPKRKASDGREYDFKRDGPVPNVGEVPADLTHNTVVSDWYPRIAAIASRGRAEGRTPEKGELGAAHLAFLDYGALLFDVEQYKRERTWHNLNVTQAGIRTLLADTTWYTLYIPPDRLKASSYENVLLWQQVAAELLRRYVEQYYNYCKAAFIEPRLELRELTPADDDLPKTDEYQLVVDASEAQLIRDIEEMKKELAKKKKDLLEAGDLQACRFGGHLYQPLFHVRKGGKIVVLPVALNESEFQFVTDLKDYCDANKAALTADGKEIFLLRNMSRGRGVGFFEARSFYPDFILWVLARGRQYVNFIEPHGLVHEGPASPKIVFRKTIKEIEARLGDPRVTLNSFVLSWTRYSTLDWGRTRAEMEKQHVLFMTDDRSGYVGKMLRIALEPG